MRALTRVRAGLLVRAADFDPRDWQLAVGRSLLALATLSVLLCTPTRALFAPLPDNPTGARCGGVRGALLWCVGGPAPWLSTARLVVAVAVLAAVLIGLRPRWTCVPHWYVTVSLGASMTVPNGGDAAGRVATMLLILMCLGDGRRWHWRAGRDSYPPGWGGSSYAAHLVLRLQVALIYLAAVGTKLAVRSWRDGTYLVEIFHHPYYGPSAALRSVLGHTLEYRPIVATLTWGTLAIEVAIAASLFAGPRLRRCGLALAIALHGLIIVLIGLFSFGMTMIALVTLASGGTRRHPPADTASMQIRESAPVA
jgi:antimicrobial peptide system SdpB family protein